VIPSFYDVLIIPAIGSRVNNLFVRYYAKHRYIGGNKMNQSLKDFGGLCF